MATTDTAREPSESARLGEPITCGACLESVTVVASNCPHCDEPLTNERVSRASLPGFEPQPSWLAMHWRPLLTLGAVMSIIVTGIALRFLAPGRFSTSLLQSQPQSAALGAACKQECWNGEACLVGRCAWQTPNNVGHVPEAPGLSGPFPMPKDVTDALLLDRDRFAVSQLTGVQIHNARTGEVLTTVSEATQVQQLFRVGDVIYATSPNRIYVIDPKLLRVRKTIELGDVVEHLTIGASGRRVLASLRNARAIAVIAAEYHAEIDRISFGDDPVGTVVTDDAGKRGLTTTGAIPVAGFRDAPGGAVYAFDPTHLATEQDRIRTSMLGNPASALMMPNGEMSFVALRAEDTIVPLDWLPSGNLRSRERLATCREPEQIELVRRERRMVVRCNEGRAVEVFDLYDRKRLRRIPFNGRPTDLAVSPDSAQLLVTITADGAGAVAKVSLDDYSIDLYPLGHEPTRVRISPDGAAAVVLADRAKVAWVLR